jgi:uncharacterized membrane protein
MTSSALLRPLLLGLATGMRSQLGLAVLVWSEPAGTGETAVLRTLRSPAGRVATGLAAAGEIVADKLPQTPSRLKAPVLGSRLLAGAAVGALAAGSTDRRALATGGALGLAGAAAGTYAGAYYRKAGAGHSALPDLPFAVGEDVIAAGLAATAVKVWPEPRPWWRRLPFTSR